MKAALGLGSNLGNRRQHLLWARNMLAERFKLEAWSAMIETPPQGEAGERSFLNAAAVVSGDFTPRQLLEFARALEEELGRGPANRKGPRALDVDLLLCDDLQVKEPDLEIPHPRLAERAFVLEPLAEVAPDWVVPGRFCSVEVLLEDLRARG